MRNLKRALSLALASIMVLGLMVVGSSAAESYTDVTAEHNVEAIEVLQAVEPAVMEGVGEGKFEPETKLTRNMMAVIMCRLLNYTVSSYKGTSNFSDVPAGHWAEEYVAACYTNGIIAGYSNTYYGGDDEVTTGQAALMIMKALGYFQEPGDFGSDWLVETIARGAKIELFDGIKNGARDSLNRNDAAQMCLNALKSDMVEITDHDLSTDGKGNLTTKAVYRSREGKDAKYSAIDDHSGITSGTRTIQLGEFLYDGNLKLNDDEPDDMGHPANHWTYRAKKVGTYVDNSDLLKTWSGKAARSEMYELIGSTTLGKIKDDSVLTVYVDGEKISSHVTGGWDNFVGTYFSKNSSGAAGDGADALLAAEYQRGTGVSGNGIYTELYMDKDSNVLIVMTSTWLMKATADYNSSKEELTVEPVDNYDGANIKAPALGSAIDQDDFDVSGFKEDDYLLVTYSYGSDDIQTVTPAELRVGKVDQYTVENSVTLDGDPLKYNKLVGGDEKSETFSVGQNATLVLDAYGYIMYVDEAITSSDYVYIREFGSQNGLSTTAKAIANAYFADGTSAEISVKKVDNTDSKSIIAGWNKTDKFNANNRWYTYTKDSNGDYTLTTPSDKKYGYDQAWNTDPITGKAEGTKVVDGEKVQFLNVSGQVANLDAKTVRADEKTVFVTLDSKDDVDVYTGVSNAPSVYAAIGLGNDAAEKAVKIAWSMKKDTGYAQYVFIDVSGDTTANVEGGSDDFLFLLHKNDGDNKTVADGTEWWNYDVIQGNELVKGVYIDSKSALAKNAGTLFYNVSMNSDEYITNGHEVGTGSKATQIRIELDGDPDKIITKSNKTLTIAGRSFIVPDSAKLHMVLGKGCPLAKDDAANYTPYVNTTLGTLAGEVKDYKLTGMAYAIVNEKDSERLEHLYLWIANAVPVTGAGKTYDVAASSSVKFSTDKTTWDTDLNDIAGGTTIYVKADTGWAIDKANSAVSLNGSSEPYTFSLTGNVAAGAVATVKSDKAEGSFVTALSDNKAEEVTVNWKVVTSTTTNTYVKFWLESWPTYMPTSGKLAGKASIAIGNLPIIASGNIQLGNTNISEENAQTVSFTGAFDAANMKIIEKDTSGANGFGPDKVKVVYKDTAANVITSMVTDTSPKEWTVANAPTTGGANDLSVAIDAGKWETKATGDGALIKSVTGITGTATVNTSGDILQNDASEVDVYSAVTSLTVDGDKAITIVIDISNLKAKTPTYSIDCTAVGSVATGVGSDKIAISASPSASIAAGTEAVISAKATALTKVFAYKVTVSVDGQTPLAQFLKTTDKTGLGKITVNEDVTIGTDDVEIDTILAMGIKMDATTPTAPAVNVSTDGKTLTFDLTRTAVDISSVTGVDGTASSKVDLISVAGNKLTITLNTALGNGETIILAVKSLTDKEYSDNTSDKLTITAVTAATPSTWTVAEG